MQESIHALRCDFLCLQGRESKRPGRSLFNYKRMRIFRSDKNGRLRISRIYNGGSTLALQRSVFRENRSKFLTFIARSVGGIFCETNEHSRSEMTDTQTHDTDPMKSAKVQTLGEVARRESDTG